jgi:hypothetical protein
MFRRLTSLSGLWRPRRPFRVLLALAVLLVTGSGLLVATSMSTPPAHAQPAELPKLTRLQRWEGSLQGCLNNTTAEEKQKWPHWIHGCACLATVLVERCAATDDIDPKKVWQCMNGQAAQANSIMGYCSRNLNLTLVKKL